MATPSTVKFPRILVAVYKQSVREGGEHLGRSHIASVNDAIRPVERNYGFGPSSPWALEVPLDAELTPRVTTFTSCTGPAPNPASGSATVRKNTRRAN